MQSRKSSLFEAILNTFTGYIISVMLIMLVLPIYGYDIALNESMEVVAIFTAVSILRSYLWRRYFNKKIVAAFENARS